MSISDRLSEIKARIVRARHGDYGDRYMVLDVDAPALVVALQAVLDVCENYPVPPSDKDVSGEVLAGMEKLERLVRAAIRDSLGEKT